MATNVSLPNSSIRVLNADGTMSLPWRLFFTSLTGVAQGVSTSNAAIFEAIAVAQQTANEAISDIAGTAAIANSAIELAEGANLLSTLAFGNNNSAPEPDLSIADLMAFQPSQTIINDNRINIQSPIVRNEQSLSDYLAISQLSSSNIRSG